MEKYIQRELKYNKSLKIDKEALKELDNLYSEIGTQAEYSIVTEDNIHYTFDNLEELLQYDFSNEIKVLKIGRHDYTKKANLDIEFKVDYISIFTVYSTIVEISYSTSDENIDILLKEKISQFYKKYATHNWIIGKFGIYCYLSILILIIAAIVLVVDFINNNSISIPISMGVIIYCIISWIGLFLIRRFDTFICKKLFKPIIYYIGKEKDKSDKVDKIKSNIFWGVIVAIIVGIITTIICNIILK